MENSYRGRRALKATAIALLACVLSILLFVFATDKPLAAQSTVGPGTSVVDLFQPDTSFLSGPPSVDDAALLARFREHCRSQPVPKLHLIAPAGGLNEPHALMKEGFVLWNYPPVPVQPPVNWTMDPFADASWRYQFNTLIFLDPVLRACEESPHPTYLKFAVDVMIDWLRQNWDKEGNPNEFAWYDMAVGVRAPKLAWLAHAAACSDDIDDDALMHLLRGALRHGQELRDPDNLSKGTNHGIYQMLGLLGLVQTLPDMRAFNEYEQYATETVEGLFAAHYCEAEGAHLEHSPAYHFYLTHLLGRSISTGLLDGQRLQVLADRAFQVLAWMIKPDGSLARFGDGEDRRKPVSRALAAPLRERYPAYWFAVTGGKQGTPAGEESLVLPQSGYAFIRGPWPTNAEQWNSGSYLAFLAAFHSRTHKHADDGTFEWCELGRPLLIDSGGFGYHYHLPERQYCESTRAHNTLEIDGQDLSRDVLHAYGSAIKRWTKAAGTHAVEAEFDRHPDIRHRRTMIYTPGEWLVVCDDIRAAGDHMYTQWFHLEPDLQIQSAGVRVEVPIPHTDRRLVVQSLTGSNLRIVRGQREPRLEGWTSLEYRKLTPNWAVAYSTTGSTARLFTLLALVPGQSMITDGEVVSCEQNGLELQWRLDGRRVRVRLMRDEDELRLDVNQGATSTPVISD